MDARTEVQIIHHNGAPAFAVVPYTTWLAMSGESEGIPHGVLERVINRGLSPLAAWRQHKNITQVAMAERLGISQASIARIEHPDSTPQLRTKTRYADALGITVAQIDF